MQSKGAEEGEASDATLSVTVSTLPKISTTYSPTDASCVKWFSFDKNKTLANLDLPFTHCCATTALS